MANDRAKHNILPPSKFGVVEITRQRVRPETDINTSEKCPTCKGTGEVQASILYAEEIEIKSWIICLQIEMEKVIIGCSSVLGIIFQERANFTTGEMVLEIQEVGSCYVEFIESLASIFICK